MKLRVYPIRAAVVPALLLATTAFADTITWDGGGDGTSWHDVTNWADDLLPGPSDDAVIGAASTVVVSATSGDQVVNGVDCAGALHITGGSLTIGAESTIESLTVGGGTLTINGAADVETLMMSSGRLGGTGDVTVNGPTTWTAGTMEGTGTLIANGDIELLGNGFKTLDRTLESAATATWSGGELFVHPAGRFVNRPGALFDVQFDVILRWNSGGPGFFENHGTFRKSGGTGITDVWLPLENQGTIDIEIGTVRLGGDGTHSGEVTGPGVVQFSLGTHTLEASSQVTTHTQVDTGTVTVLGTFDVPSLAMTSGTLDVGGGTTAMIGGAFDLSNGTLTGGGDVTVTGLLTWTTGTIDGTGTLYADGGIELRSTAKLLDRRLESSGTTTWTSGQIRIASNGRFVNLPSALFDVQSDSSMWSNVSPGTFENRGTFRKSTSTGTTDIRVPIENTGTVELLSGKVISREGYTQTAGVTRVDTELEFEPADQLDLLGGVLNGNGLVDGFIYNDGGTISPGLSPGQLNVEGDVDQTVLGTFIVELGGPDAGAFDVLAIDGDAFLGGLLEIRRFEGYIPPVGEFFTILTTTGSRIGIFDETACEDFFRIDYLDQGVRLEVLAELSPADLNQDCSVGFADLQILLQSWGPCDPPPPAFCLGDINKDGGVGFADLQTLLQQWG